MMVSVKRFVEDEPALFEASQAFVDALASVPDPVILVASPAPTVTARMAWVLLGTTLFQERDYPQIVMLLRALYEHFPAEKLWALPVPSGHDLEAAVESTFSSRQWSLFEHVAGIFWSVGLFVRHHPDLEVWARERTPEEMWRDLGEIYFMGKGNPRPKACAAIYRLIAPPPLGLGVVYRKSRKMPPLPLTMGARRFLSMLGPAMDEGFAGLEPEKKQTLANRYYAALAPRNPYLASHALQFFLEQGKSDFICRERTETCRLCPLYTYCDYAVHHELSQGC